MTEAKAKALLASKIDTGEIKVAPTREQAQKMLKLMVQGATFGEAWVATL